MKKYITISREYGSGGHTIAKSTAEKLGLPFYDREIIDLAAKESGLSAEFIQKTEQSLSSGWLYTMLLGTSYAAPSTSGISAGSAQPHTLPLADQVFNAQRSVIINLAKKGSCVIVGRCADYILRNCEEVDRKDVLNVFVYAPLADKVRRAIEQKGLDPATAEREVKLIDKRRANHYNTFTERTWGNRSHYDLLINSSLLGLEKSAALIADIARES